MLNVCSSVLKALDRHSLTLAVVDVELVDIDERVKIPQEPVGPIELVENGLKDRMGVERAELSNQLA